MPYTKRDIKKIFGCYIFINSPYDRLPGSWLYQFGQGRIKLQPAEELVFEGKFPHIRKAMEDSGDTIVEMLAGKPDEYGTRFSTEVWVEVAGVMEGATPTSMGVGAAQSLAFGVASGLNPMVSTLGTVADGISLVVMAGSAASSQSTGSGKMSRALHKVFGKKQIVTVTAQMPPETSKFSNPRGKLPGPTVTWSTLSQAVGILGRHTTL